MAMGIDKIASLLDSVAGVGDAYKANPANVKARTDFATMKHGHLQLKYSNRQRRMYLGVLRRGIRRDSKILVATAMIQLKRLGVSREEIMETSEHASRMVAEDY